ncbi:MAG: HDIG domain-containing protein [Candidatus Promineifilaceae bacterium]|nr:HDIG domain-containing protein [Candidatus Promineifilaceae bacterium]
METVPATRQQLKETFKELRLGVFTVTLILGMTLILSFNLAWTSQVAVMVGEPAPADVFAPRSLTYTSDLLTEQERQNAANNVSEIFTPLNLTIGREQLAKAQGIFAFIDTIRADSQAAPEDKAQYIQAIQELIIDESVTQNLLEMSQNDYELTKVQITEIIDSVMTEEIQEGQLDLHRRRAERQASLGLTNSQRNVVTSLAPQFVVPTIFQDEEATATERTEAAASIEPVILSVAKDQRIVRAGELITAQDEELLEQLGLLRQDLNWRNVASVFLLSLLSVTLIDLYWLRFRSRQWDKVRYLSVLGGLILLFTLIAKLLASTPGDWPLLFPLAAMSMILAVVFDVRFSVLVTVILAAIYGYIAPNSLEFSLFVAVGGLIAVFTLRDSQRIVAYFRSGLFAALGGIVVLLLYALPLETETAQALTQFLYSLGNGMLSAALTLVSFFVLGSVFGIITTLQLQDLSRLDHPLLQELLRRAPGTYHHSIMVANLAEQAAERIQANSTLVRVGAFYHDIGKMNRPQFFTENQEGVNPHDSLDPYTSARIIISHVADGLVLARRYRLPHQIRDFIAEHHGDRLVKGFYAKACAQANNNLDKVDVEKFHHRGPRPRTRESGIVMLADAVEATSSALRPNTSAAIEKLVNSIVDDDVMEGQLNNSGLSLGDIEIIRSSFIDTLKGRFHLRVKYPGNEALDVPQEQVLSLPEPQADSEQSIAPPQSTASTIFTGRDVPTT